MSKRYKDVDLMKIRANAETLNNMGFDMLTLSLFYLEIKDFVKLYSITDDNVQTLLDLGFRLYFDFSEADRSNVATLLENLLNDLYYEVKDDEELDEVALSNKINDLIKELTYARVSNDFIYSL